MLLLFTFVVCALVSFSVSLGLTSDVGKTCSYILYHFVGPISSLIVYLLFLCFSDM